MAHRLRSAHLDALRLRAHEYLDGASRPVNSRELARHLFDWTPRDDAVSHLLVRMLLHSDARFVEVRSDTWELVHAAYRDQRIDEARFAVVDLEATGGDPCRHRILEVAIVIVERGRVVTTYSSLVQPLVAVPRWIQRLTGIEHRMLQDAPRLQQIAPVILQLLRNSIFVAHGSGFDHRLLGLRLQAKGFLLPPVPRLCTLQLAQHVLPQLRSCGLAVVAEHLGVPLRQHHRAHDDAMATAGVLVRLLRLLKKGGVRTLGELLDLASPRSSAFHGYRRRRRSSRALPSRRATLTPPRGEC